jgi:hypothetical protein
MFTASVMTSSRHTSVPGLTLVNLSAQREHCLWKQEEEEEEVEKGEAEEEQEQEEEEEEANEEEEEEDTSGGLVEIHGSG